MVPNANPNKNPQRTVGDSQRTVGELSTDPSTPLEGAKRRWGHSVDAVGGRLNGVGESVEDSPTPFGESPNAVEPLPTPLEARVNLVAHVLSIVGCRATVASEAVE